MSLGDRPIAGAVVKFAQSSNGSPPLLRSATTDIDGRFLFSDVPAGKHYLSVEKRGFWPTSDRTGMDLQTLVSVLDQDVSLKQILAPGANIFGALHYESGESARGITVRLLKRKVRRGEYIWEQIGQDSSQQRETDSNGAFVFAGLQPGSYWLQASPLPARPVVIHQSSMPLDARISFVPSYFPGVSRSADAKTITVAPLQQYDARWVLNREKFYPVIVPYSSDLAAHAGSGSARAVDKEGQSVSEVLWDYDKHRFIFFAPRGSYSLSVDLGPGRVPWADGSPKSYMGYKEIKVGGDPQVVDEIALEHPVSLPFHAQTVLKQENRFHPTVSSEIWSATQQMCIDFATPECWSMSQPHPAQPVLNFNPGTYIVGSHSPRGTYFALLKCGSTDLLRERLVVAGDQPVCAVEAVLRDDPASIEVRLSPENNAAMAESKPTHASLFFIPLDSLVSPPPFQPALFNRDGMVKIEAVPPGRYLAVIVDLGEPRIGLVMSPPMPPDPPIAYRDPEVFKKLNECGKQITLLAGDQAVISAGWCPLK